MQQASAGLLMYRKSGSVLEVFLVHPGGPFGAKRDQGAWSIPKGLIGEERQVLRLGARGLLNKQIAGELGIVEGTVKQHRGAGTRKLGIVSVAELVPLVRSLDPLTEESSVLQTLEAAKRLLESLADRSIRGGRHVRAALRQIAKAIEANKRRA